MAAKEGWQIATDPMGLALSKGLVEAMDGSLTAESVEGQGTTFTVELPERSHRLLSGAPSRP
jgi:signal transduction histidine kinase